MGYLMNVSEVLEFAVYIEQNGYQFYVESLKKFPEPNIVELFQYLADEEFKHEQLFKKMLAEAGKFTPTETYDGEYQAYMREFCKSHSLADRDASKAKIKAVSSLEGALEMAVAFEKDSIVFFTQLKDLVGGEQRSPVDRIIHEEMLHLRRIFEFREQLNKK